MKKLVLFLFVIILATGSSYSVVKVNFKLANPHLESGMWTIDVMCTIPAGQQWRVGSSNLRFNFTTTPTGAATVHPDATVSGANTNIHSNANYGIMTTTSISGGAAISLNIVRGSTGNCYYMTPGTYTLGRIRFNRVDTTGCIKLNMRTTVSGFSVVQDSITQWLSPADFDTLATVPPGCIRLDFLTGLEGSNIELPTVFKLYNNYPNPFNPATTIKYDVPSISFVKMTIYDILGKEVSRLVNQQMSPGRYEVNWDASKYASGTYLYKFEANDFVDIKKMVLVK